MLPIPAVPKNRLCANLSISVILLGGIHARKTIHITLVMLLVRGLMQFFLPWSFRLGIVRSSNRETWERTRRQQRRKNIDAAREAGWPRRKRRDDLACPTLVGFKRAGLESTAFECFPSTLPMHLPTHNPF